MAGLLSAQAQHRVAALRKMSDRIQHVYGLVERFAATTDEKAAVALSQPLKRSFGRLKLELMGAGFDTMSQLAGAMEIAAGRSGNQRSKSRILREGIGSLRFQVEQEARKTVAEDEQARKREKEQEQEQPGP